MKKQGKKQQFPRRKGAGIAQRIETISETTAAELAAQMNGLPTFAIVAAINGMVEALRERGQEIRDWEEKDKVIQKITVIGGRVYSMATRK